MESLHVLLSRPAELSSQCRHQRSVVVTLAEERLDVSLHLAQLTLKHARAGLQSLALPLALSLLSSQAFGLLLEPLELLPPTVCSLGQSSALSISCGLSASPSRPLRRVSLALLGVLRCRTCFFQLLPQLLDLPLQLRDLRCAAAPFRGIRVISSSQCAVQHLIGTKLFQENLPLPLALYPQLLCLLPHLLQLVRILQTLLFPILSTIAKQTSSRLRCQLLGLFSSLFPRLLELGLKLLDTSLLCFC
mmetsp:Transcript_70811/g.133817  ORF Transcript_70811/g.133817 Transcript_70811/m.133817 type:complete len:247 (+) Transcript_70811:600-1340(+)